MQNPKSISVYSVLVPDARGIVVLLVGALEDLLENVLEAAVVTLQDGVLGGQVERPLLLQSDLRNEGGAGQC
jgi:hypothetical protein